MTSPRPTPWTLRYADGSANVYRFTRPAADAPVQFEYIPVKPAFSSSGTYSGGDPVRAELAADDPRIDELWSRTERLEADRSVHASERGKGTGAFTIETPAGTREFIIVLGPARAGYDEFVAGFRR